MSDCVLCGMDKEITTVSNTDDLGLVVLCRDCNHKHGAALYRYAPIARERDALRSLVAELQGEIAHLKGRELQQMQWAARQEREECARIAETWDGVAVGHESHRLKCVAAAIRARRYAEEKASTEEAND